MGFGFLKIANNFLRSRNLVIKEYDAYAEKINQVNYDWLKPIGIQTVLDVGASNGGFATLARNIFPTAQIHSFEPLTKSFEDLKKKFAADNNFSAHQLVCADKNSEMDFFENDYTGSSSIIPMADLHKEAYPQTVQAKQIKVKAVRLDEYFSSLNCSKNILLKIDVQGAEDKVLNGAAAILKDVKVVFIETSFRELYVGQWLFNDTYQFLIHHGFVLAGMENISQNMQDGGYLQADAFFVKN